MKIAIHKREGSFSDRWIQYCEENKIPYKIINCYDSDIIEQLKDCDGLMWHWSQGDYKAQNFARQLIVSLSHLDIKVFPDINTCWHFDDKLGQKYLLESIDAPVVASYAFYSKKEALEWMKSVELPIVFKLRGGAGSNNVKLVKSVRQAKKIINKAFKRGFPLIEKTANLKGKVWNFKKEKNLKNVFNIFKGLARIVIPPKGQNLLPRQKGYVYFQKFIKNNKFDIRVIEIGDKAFAIKRMVRTNDFRASGSGLIKYEKKEIDIRCVKIAFDVNKKIKSQSIAFDFVFDEMNNPLIVEISYGYSVKAYDYCPGYWDSDLNWHEADVKPEYFIIEYLIHSIKV